MLACQRQSFATATENENGVLFQLSSIILAVCNGTEDKEWQL